MLNIDDLLDLAYLCQLKPGLDAVDPRLYPAAERALLGDREGAKEYSRILREVGRNDLADRMNRLEAEGPWNTVGFEGYLGPKSVDILSGEPRDRLPGGLN